MGNTSAPCIPANIATPSVDLEAPSTPTDLAGGATSTTTIALTWSASTDNVGVTGYRVYRNGGSTPVGSPTATSFTDSDLTASTTYAYRVAAIDAAGNLSAPCDAVNVRTLDPSAQQYTATLTGTGVIDDTFLYASSPTTNYGATSYMSTTDRFLIRFDLAPYANRRIVSAQISFYVWSQSNWQAGQYLDLYRVTRAWSELQATWNLAATGVPWTTAGATDVPGDHAELAGRVLQTSGGDHVYYPAADVTALVQKWAAGTVSNFGLLLVNASLTQIGLKACEYSSGPQLVITYTDEPAPDLYGMWVHSRFTDAQLANPALEATVWGTGTDPDGDGTINLFEYALGTDPNSAAGNAATALRCAPVADSTDLQLTFKRVKGLQGVAIGLERSTDLAAWSAVPGTGYTETATDCGCGLETVVWRFAPASGDDCGFYRLRLQAL